MSKETHVNQKRPTNVTHSRVTKANSSATRTPDVTYTRRKRRMCQKRRVSIKRDLQTLLIFWAISSATRTPDVTYKCRKRRVCIQKDVSQSKEIYKCHSFLWAISSATRTPDATYTCRKRHVCIKRDVYQSKEISQCHSLETYVPVSKETYERDSFTCASPL